MLVILISSANKKSDNEDKCSEYLSVMDDGIAAQLKWADLDYNLYCLSYTMTSTDYTLSWLYRDVSLKTNHLKEGTDIWPYIYKKIYLNEKNKITFMIDSLKELQVSEHLNRSDFAKTVVTMIQDIPYSYVLWNESCDDHVGPCIDDVKWGLYTPTEFLYTHQGDCDTRTLTLYTLLKELGYHPILLTSNAYRHSIIGLDIPASGDHIVKNGIKYYLWETTNTGWDIGMLPPEMNDISKWDITLQ